MSARKVVVVDDDPQILKLLEVALRTPEFDVHLFAAAEEALARLAGIAPDLIVCDMRMPGMEGPELFHSVKKMAELRDVPFIFLSAVQSNDEIVELLEAGADDFVNKPFHLSRLVAKVRAVLRLADRRRDALTGPVGKGGTLPLLKFCEDSRLSGKLTVEHAGEKHWADFVGGEMVQVGGPGDRGAGGLGAEERSDGAPMGSSAGIHSRRELPYDALGALLALESGSYRVEQRRLDRHALHASQERPLAPAPAPASGPITMAATLPGGRLSMVEARGRSLQVQTECENRPNFTVTTVIARGGQIVRKVESSWQHPLQRVSDVEMARSQVDRQHDRVVATLRSLAEGRAAEAGAAAGAPTDAPREDDALLAWAVSFVAEQARALLGAVMTVALLRRTHRELVVAHPALRVFRVADDGRVVLAAEKGADPALVEAASAWTIAFLHAAGEIAEAVRAFRVRQVTRMMESELDRIGFYRGIDS